MALADALTTLPYHSPSGRAMVSPGVHPDPEGPLSWAVVVGAGASVVTTVVVEVVDEATVGAVVERAIVVTVTSGAMVWATPLEPEQPTPSTSDNTTAIRRRLTGSSESSEEAT